MINEEKRPGQGNQPNQPQKEGNRPGQGRDDKQEPLKK